MAAVATPSSPGLARLAAVAASLRTETGLARLGLGLVALHVVDDSWLQPNPGTSAGDHLLAGLVPLALLVAAIVFYPRLRAGARALLALSGGFFGVLVGTEAVYYTRAVGPSGDDFTGLLSIAGRPPAARPRRRRRSGGRAAATTRAGGATRAGCCSPAARSSSRTSC